MSVNFTAQQEKKPQLCTDITLMCDLYVICNILYLTEIYANSFVNLTLWYFGIVFGFGRLGLNVLGFKFGVI